MRRRPYSGPHPSDPAAVAGLRARLAKAAAAPKPCGEFKINQGKSA